MKHTPLDFLLHDAILYRDKSPIHKQFFEMLTAHPLGVYRWPEWRDLSEGTHLDGDGSFGPEAPHFFLFAEQGITPGYHQPCVVTATEDTDMAVWPSECSWQLQGAIVYRLDANNFDVVGLMRTLEGIHNLPELQLRFTRVDGRWTWRRAQTGFINPYVYEPIVYDMTDEQLSVLDEAVEYYGNVMSLFLGGYHQWLQCNGTWQEKLPKQARVKQGKDGKIKKFYRIASSGYMTFVPEYVNGK